MPRGARRTSGESSLSCAKYFRKFTGSAPRDYRRDLEVLTGADMALDDNQPV